VELHDLYSSGNVTRMNEVKEGEVARLCKALEEERNAYKILVGKSEGKSL
jgi:hypothetical protein